MSGVSSTFSEHSFCTGFNEQFLKMFHRKPTRIELKVEDLQEYETMKKENEQKSSIEDKEGDITTEAVADEKTQKEIVAERIGYKPQPKDSI
ncbi:hypothetical protein JTE90_022897 [Oedothorax gibbosus]|uniref:Anaphase-promoting complex subunit CDC26 n=1 Tax=Oedothorax gibbosus TaxID=931172 RepID=A0AAV6UTP0_9ARAC|nr:hypothetical protein JTE90_022897 [Oedothorax gibbosus]